MATPLPVLVMQAQHVLELVERLAADLSALPPRTDYLQAMHVESAQHLPHAAAVLLQRAVAHLRGAVDETPVAPCVLTEADRAEAQEATSRG